MGQENMSKSIVCWGVDSAGVREVPGVASWGSVEGLLSRIRQGSSVAKEPQLLWTRAAMVQEKHRKKCLRLRFWCCTMLGIFFKGGI